MIAAAALLLTIPGLVAFGLRFHARQNGGALGGAISRAKAYWLPFAIWFWFVLCPVVAFDGVAAWPLRLALGSFGVFMWLRGAIEMVMLYGTRNWRPPIGITHDVLCILLILGVLGTHAGDILALQRSLDLWTLGLVAAAIVSLCVEIHHAWSFFQAVKGMTTGEDGVWFADDEQEHFRRINRNTLVWNVVLSIVVGAYLLRYLVELFGSAS